MGGNNEAAIRIVSFKAEVFVPVTAALPRLLSGNGAVVVGRLGGSGVHSSPAPARAGPMPWPRLNGYERPSCIGYSQPRGRPLRRSRAPPRVDLAEIYSFPQ